MTHLKMIRGTNQYAKVSVYSAIFTVQMGIVLNTEHLILQQVNSEPS